MEDTWIQMIIGFVLLVTGRRLFWLFVGVAGFLAGSSLASEIWNLQSQWQAWGMALVFGVGGIFLAFLAQRLAVAGAGFIMGAYSLAWLFLNLGLHGTVWGWLALLIGGVSGAAVAYWLFDFALIGLSSLVGSVMIVSAMRSDPYVLAIVWTILVGLGIAVQTLHWRREL